MTEKFKIWGKYFCADLTEIKHCPPQSLFFLHIDKKLKNSYHCRKQFKWRYLKDLLRTHRYIIYLKKNNT